MQINSKILADEPADETAVIFSRHDKLQRERFCRNI